MGAKIEGYESWRVLERWCAEHDHSDELDFFEAVDACEKWITKHGAEKYLDAANPVHIPDLVGEPKP